MKINNNSEVEKIDSSLITRLDSETNEAFQSISSKKSKWDFNNPFKKKEGPQDNENLNKFQIEVNALMRIQTWSLKSLIFTVLILTIPVSLIINFYTAFLIIKTRWSNKKINWLKYVFGILNILPFGFIAAFWFGFKVATSFVKVEK